MDEKVKAVHTVIVPVGAPSGKDDGRSLASTDLDAELLAALGYKQQFRRAFRPIELFGVVFSLICIVPGLSSVLVYSLPNGGPVAMVWGWVVVSGFSVCVTLALAELASAAPTSGGLYYWTHRFASPRWRNLLAWLVGYANTLAYITMMSAGNWALALMVSAAVSIGTDMAWNPTTAQLYGVSCALIISEATMSSVATKVIARAQWVYITFNILLFLAVIIALPISTPRELINRPAYVFGHFENSSGWRDGVAFLLSFLSPLFATGGYDAPIHVSEEASNANVMVPRAMVIAICMASIIGWATVIALVFCMGTDIAGIVGSPIGQPMAVIMFNSFGKKGVLAVWSILAITFYMAATSLLTVASRQCFAFARDGALPVSGLLYRINPFTHTPVNCVWFVCAIAMLVSLLAFAGSAAISALFTMAIASLYITYIIPIATRFVFKNDFKPGPFSLGRLSFPIAATSVLWMLFVVVMLLFPTSPNPSAATMNYAVVVTGGVLALSTMYFYLPVYGGRYWFTGPKRNIDFDEGTQSGALCEDKLTTSTMTNTRT
ncbi:APC amino acid permease [Punctularia strigosozonata HHB-11173 SS5]|uniref:APC amino acid permease n=1 Tax=Punctularia strigosozonata (strain HHB-11173) TaxID=741275 RepID=UPI0004417B50|nr:APC amino acid permease [Punctularia strigosozonata HHB-11173 SS5]EIN08575.1 APC amino acid permease [Punctularia strigosozonata HHB-11173 SS5]